MASSSPFKIRSLAGVNLTILCRGSIEQKSYAEKNGLLDGSLINNDVFVEKILSVVKIGFDGGDSNDNGDEDEDDNYSLMRREALEILLNSTRNCNPAQVIRLLMSGVYSCFVDVLILNDEIVLLLALEGISNCLKWGKQYNLNDENGASKFMMELGINGGIRKIEELQDHQSTEVYEAALKILEENFEIEGEL